LTALPQRWGCLFAPDLYNLRANQDDGTLAGGLTAYPVQGWLFIKLLGVVEDQRGKGIGRALLERAEDFARAKGLGGVYLDTFDFQAPVFYERLGYIECGRLPVIRGGRQRIWLAKTFEVPELPAIPATA
jgi:GNAT superfamily N-acetyltransferase